MIYHGEFADDLPLLLREGGARLLVLLRGGMPAHEKAFAPIWVATRETFLDGYDKLALWELDDYVRFRALNMLPQPDIAWLPGRGFFHFSDGTPAFPPKIAMTRAETDREYAWVAMRYYFAWRAVCTGHEMSREEQLHYYEENVHAWKKSVGAQWSRLGVPHPASFAQVVFVGTPNADVWGALGSSQSGGDACQP